MSKINKRITQIIQRIKGITNNHKEKEGKQYKKTKKTVILKKQIKTYLKILNLYIK